MATTFKRRAAAGFTLIELLIVVVILAILAAIAIPQFSTSTSDAQMAALDANLSSVRAALETYKVQHTGNVYPGTNASAAMADCTTNGSTGIVATAGKPAMDAQLKNYTDAAGNACPIGGLSFKYGPYLRQGLPVEPFSGKSDLDYVATGAPVTASKKAGWAYSAQTGQFQAANSDVPASGDGRAYSAH